MMAECSVMNKCESKHDERCECNRGFAEEMSLVCQGALYLSVAKLQMRNAQRKLLVLFLKQNVSSTHHGNVVKFFLLLFLLPGNSDAPCTHRV